MNQDTAHTAICTTAGPGGNCGLAESLTATSGARFQAYSSELDFAVQCDWNCSTDYEASYSDAVRTAEHPPIAPLNIKPIHYAGR